MCAMWVGLGAEEDRDGVRRALSSIDDVPQISFAGSAQEIRHWALEAERRVGAVIGPVEDAISPMNAAAALAKDGVAHPVMLVSKTLDEGLRRGAGRDREVERALRVVRVHPDHPRVDLHELADSASRGKHRICVPVRT